MKPENIGFLIEFLGPSGVGKSTFLNEIREMIPSCWMVNSLYQPVTNRFSGDHEVQDFYRQISRVKCEELILNNHFFDVPALVHHYTSRAQADYAFTQNYFQSNLHVCDEGLFHLFGDAIIDTCSKTPRYLSTLRKIIARRTLVSFNFSEKTILEHLQQRGAQFPKSSNDQIGNWGLELARSELLRYKSMQNKVIELVLNTGGNILSLNEQAGQEENKSLVLKHIFDVCT